MRVSARSPRLHLRAPTTLLLCCCCLCWPVDGVRPTRFGEFPASRFWPETAETKDILRGDSPDFVGDHPGYTASFHFTPCLSHARPHGAQEGSCYTRSKAPTPWYWFSTCWATTWRQIFPATILATEFPGRPSWRLWGTWLPVFSWFRLRLRSACAVPAETLASSKAAGAVEGR